MTNSLFITGTDTGVGKTIVTGLLARFLKEKGVKIVTQKWIQTGCAGESEDIAVHMDIMKNDDRYDERYHSDMAPYILEFPSSPHLAASLEKKQIDTGRIEKSFHRLTEDFEFVIAEGSGGPLVPINEKEMIVDIAEKLGLRVLIVAANRLGAINQTLLTIEALKKRNLSITGIVFNRLSEAGDEMILKDNMQIVEKISGVKVLGELCFNRNTDILYENFLHIGEKIAASFRLSVIAKHNKVNWRRRNRAEASGGI